MLDKGRYVSKVLISWPRSQPQDALAWLAPQVTPYQATPPRLEFFSLGVLSGRPRVRVFRPLRDKRPVPGLVGKKKPGAVYSLGSPLCPAEIVTPPFHFHPSLA
jgi:hypothetical protein